MKKRLLFLLLLLFALFAVIFVIPEVLERYGPGRGTEVSDSSTGTLEPESGRTEPGTETLESRTFPYETVETETETEETPPETEYDPGEPVAREKIETNLMIASDIHYMSPSLTDYGKAYQTMADNGDGKVIQYMPQIWEAFASKGKEPDAGQKFEWWKTRDDRIRGTVCRIKSNGLSMELITDGQIEDAGEITETYYYPYDACDGRRESGSAMACHRISICAESGCEETLSVIYDMDGSDMGAGHVSGEESTDTPRGIAAQIIDGLKTYRKGLEELAGFRDENARILSKSADQFISLRESTGRKTILAGYPFFEDWGRDTMIALPGVCISVHRYEEAESILRTFAAYERRGLMPNLFPEGRNDPMYNTVDAALLFINCVWLYSEASGNTDFVEEMYPVMERIIESYKAGTDYEIRMDEDSLIMAGSGLDQVTWMDVRVGEILPTPRHGKPVEINAYWYNALRIMGRFSDMLGKSGEAYEALADKVRASFEKEFWMEEKHCLRDVVSGTKADTQIRCNQIWAVSMPFTMLGPDKERQIVDTVFEKLYTPYGLRTLEEADPEFKPFYGGEVLKRDLAYHQGTVWAYPLGAYYMAYLKVHGYSSAAKAYVKGQLEVMEGAMREGCIGQLPEIYDGDNPVSSKGCFAQAWSTGEILRVYEELER